VLSVVENDYERYIMREINISVRSIVEFILRSGSIDAGYMSQSRMQDGVRVHQRVQRARKREAAAKGLEYEAEMRLRLSFEYGGMNWNISGVADGVAQDGDAVAVEEIKSTNRNLDAITLDEGHWHMAQAKCYGYMLAEARGFEVITVNLTYCQVEGDDSRVFSTDFTAGELKAFFYDLIDRYLRWAELRYNKQSLARSSVKTLAFPYERYRKGQREFAGLAYYAIRDNTKLYIEAPTGTGKTISALFPAIKALGEDICDKIFYLTAKTITRQAAEHAAGLLMENGAKLTYVAMTAKDKLCILPERACTPAACPCADGHFDRVNDALWEILNRTERITRMELEHTAAEFTVCPYELMLDATLFADLIICDYNYAFDPKVSLKRFFGAPVVTEKYAFLIDEAHNLVDRAREMYSSALCKSDFDKIRKAFRGRGNKLGQLITEIINEIKKIGLLIPETAQSRAGADMPHGLHRLLTGLTEQMDKWLAANTASEHFADSLDTYFKVLDFIRVYDNMDERYTVYLERFKSEIEITLLCLDPSGDLSKALDKSTGAVFFSATLAPLNYFKNVLGGAVADKTARLPSPFDRSRLCTVIENRISTKYKDRSPQGFIYTANALYAMISAKKGNYFAFFSSYAYLENVLEVFNGLYPAVTILVQGRDMNEGEREAFLAEFTENSEILAFAVMGGVFSEGIDLVGNRLIGAAIVGVGLPLISPKRDALRDYYDDTISGGFEYAYMYPGMNKVMQAAGRVIRTEADRGVILLVDTRFTDARYTELFPFEWRGYRKPGINYGLDEIFAEFWQALD